MDGDLMGEIELLRDQMNRVGEPSTAFVGRVRNHLAAAIDQEIGPPVAAKVGRRRFGLTAPLLVAACLVLLLAALGAIYAFQPSSPITGTSPSWKLVGFLSQPVLTQNQNGPAGGSLTCATETTCYVVVDQASGDNTVEATQDGGSHWTSMPLPPGITLTTALQCVSTSVCIAGGKDSNGEGQSSAFLITTVDGGQGWTGKPLPAGVGSLFGLSCTSASVCAGLASNESPPGVGDSFVESVDGGSHWSVSTIPSMLSNSLFCTSGDDCVVTGNVPSSTPGTAGQGAVVVTRTGGQSWQSGVLPSQIANISGVSCVSGSTTCFAISAVPDAATTCETSPTPPTTAGDQVCGSPGGNLVTEVVSTSDGGLTWSLNPFPSSVPEPEVFSLSCPTVSQCWAVGSEAKMNQSTIGGVPSVNGGSPLLLETQDGGGSWTSVTVPVPSNAPEGELLSAIGQIQCASSTRCLGLGVSSQGATHTLVYSYDA